MSKTGYPPHRRIPALPVLRGIHGHCHRRRRPALGRVAPPLRLASGSGRVQSLAWSETQSLPERQPDFFVLGLAPKSQVDRGDTPAEDLCLAKIPSAFSFSRFPFWRRVGGNWRLLTVKTVDFSAGWNFGEAQVSDVAVIATAFRIARLGCRWSGGEGGGEVRGTRGC